MSSNSVQADEPPAEMEATEVGDRQACTAGLRALADWLDAHPDAALPALVAAGESCGTKDEMVERRRVLGGQWQKSETSISPERSWFELRRYFGPSIYYELFARREAVCERVVVGTERVEVEEPDPEAVAALPTITRKTTVEDVVWRCPDSLIGGAS